LYFVWLKTKLVNLGSNLVLTEQQLAHLFVKLPKPGCRRQQNDHSLLIVYPLKGRGKLLSALLKDTSKLANSGFDLHTVALECHAGSYEYLLTCITYF